MDRKTALFNCVRDYSIGTIWRVREDVWKERKTDYDQTSNRLWHPGLSIKRTKINNSLEAIPMLHGTSRGSKRKSVIIKGITEEEGPEKKTYFGRIIAPLLMSDFTDSEKSDKQVVKEFDVQHIVRNSHKPKITDEEMVQLKKWLVKKGMY